MIIISNIKNLKRAPVHVYVKSYLSHLHNYFFLFFNPLLCCLNTNEEWSMFFIMKPTSIFSNRKKRELVSVACFRESMHKVNYSIF